MKKLLFLLALLFLSFLVIGQNNMNQLSDHRQGSMAQDTPTITQTNKKHNSFTKEFKNRDIINYAIDTLVKQNPDISVYYLDDPFFYSNYISRFYHGGFNYWMYSDPWIYNNYWMMSMEDWYWEYRFCGYPYWNYGYNLSLMLWGGPWDYGRYNYWNPWNPWRYNYYNPWRFNQHWNNLGNPYYANSGGGARNNFHQNSFAYTKTGSAIRTNTVAKPIYSASRRTYTPSYQIPSRNARPMYNNSRSGVNMQRNYSNISRRGYAMPNVVQRSNSQGLRYSNSGSVSRGSYGSSFGSGSSYSSGSSRSMSSGSFGSSRSSGSGSSGRR